MRKNVLFTVLLLSLMGLQEKVQAQYFSAISPSGHTLYYEVINETNHWVEVTNPNHSYRWDSWTNYSTPYGNVIVPPTVNWNGIDWTVRHIGHDAFFDCQTIQGLTLPEGIDSIKEYALYNINIDTLVIPSTVTFIGQGLFNCPRMHYLTIPASVQQIAHEWGEGGSILGINVAEGNPYYRSIDGCLVRQTNDIVELMVFPRARFQNVDSVVIPEGVTKIDFPVQEGIYKHKLIVPSTMTYLRLSNDNENGYAYDTIVFHGMMPPALIDNNGTIGYVQRFELPCGARRSYSVTAWGQYADRFFTNNYLTQREYSHTIAYGESYPWGDNTLTERGVYEDTLLSVVEGCDSLHRVLTLNVVQHYRDDITLNAQLPAYNYHGLTVDHPGIYEVTVSGEGDFDSLFILRASAEVNSTVATVALGGIFDGQSFDLPAMENRQLVRGVDTITVTNVHQILYDTVDVTIAEGSSYYGHTLAGVYQDTIYAADYDSVVRTRISMTVNRPMDSCTVQLGGNQGGTYFAGDEFYTVGTEISVEPSKSKTLQYTPDVLGENLLPFYSMEENDCFSNYQSQYIGDYLTAPNAGMEIWGDRGVDNSPCMMFGYSTAPDQAFFRTSLSTKVGEKYNLSFMASSSHNDIAIFVLKVNGILTTQTDTLVCCNQAGLRYFEHIIEATSDVTTIELINVQMEPGPYGIGWYIDNMSLTKVYSPTEDTITITNTHGMVYDTVDVPISEGESYHGHTLAGVYQDTILGADADSIVRSRVSMTVNRPLDNCLIPLGSNITGSWYIDGSFVANSDNITLQVAPSENRQLVFYPGAYGTNLIVNGDFENSNIESFITDYATPDSPGSPYRTYSHQGGVGVDGSNGVYFDGSTIADQSVISVTSATVPGFGYSFSYMARSACGDNPSYFQVKMNGVPQERTDVIPLNGSVWSTFTYDFIATTNATTIDIVDLCLQGNGNDFYLDNISLVQTTANFSDTITITNTHGMVYDTVDVTIAEGQSYRGHTLAGVYQDTILGAETDSIVYARVSMDVNYSFGNGMVGVGTNQEGHLWRGVNDEVQTLEPGFSVQLQPQEERRYVLTSVADGSNMQPNGDFEQWQNNWSCDYAWGSVPFHGGHYIFLCDTCGRTGIGIAATGSGLENRYVYTSEWMNLVEGHRYSFSYWAKSHSGNPAQLAIDVYDQQRTYRIADTADLGEAMDEWKRYEHVFTAWRTYASLVRITDLNTSSNGNEFFLDDVSLIDLTEATDARRDTITLRNIHQLHYATIDTTIEEGEIYNGHTTAGVYNDTMLLSDYDSVIHSRVSYLINTTGEGAASLAANTDGLWFDLDNNRVYSDSMVNLYPMQTRTFGLLVPTSDTNLIVNGDFEQGNTGFTSHFLYRPEPYDLGDGTYYIGGYRINTMLDNHYIYAFNYWEPRQGALYETTANVLPNTWYRLTYRGVSDALRGDVTTHPYGNDNTVKVNGQLIGVDLLTYSGSTNISEAEKFTHFIYNESDTVISIELNTSYGETYYFAYDDITLTPLTVVDTITVTNRHQIVHATVDTTINEGEIYNGYTTAGVYVDTLFLTDYDSITTSRVSMVINSLNGEVQLASNQLGWWKDTNNIVLAQSSIFTTQVPPMQTRQYVFDGQMAIGNMLVNGNFEQGMVGFTSQYNYSDGCRSCGPNNYAVIDGFGVNGGNCLSFDGSESYGTVLYEQTIEAIIGATYSFNYLASTNGQDNSNPAYFEVLVNGVAIGSWDYITTTYPEWNTFEHTFVANNGTLTLQIIDRNTESSGNDCLIDELELVVIGGASIITDTITITNRHQLVYDTTRADICQGGVYTVDSIDYANAGTYTLNTLYYIDSTVYPTLILDVHNNYYPQLTQAICEGESYAFDGDTLTATGTYVDPHTTIWGCDSTTTLNLTVHAHTASQQTENVCDNYMWHGTVYTASTIVIDTIDNVHGCDSVCTLNLTVRYSTTGDTAATACDYFNWYNQTYTASGTPTHTLTNAVGCDSTLTLALTVNYSTTGSETYTVCDSLTWHDALYTVSGTYQDMLTNIVGCDSIVTLYLTVNSTYQHTDAVFACDNQLPYMYHEQPLNTAGDHAVHFQSVAGCDSTVTVTLTVGATYQHSDQLALCQSGMPYTYGDRTFLEDDTTGVYTIPFSSVEGCDSIISLDLTVHESEATEIYVVTVQATNNLVLWQPAAAVESYRIYRESSTSGIYSLMAEVPYDEGGSWLDTESDARQHSYRYRMTSVDSCGVESERSPIHRTMHLTINQGVGNSWNLVWTEYQGTTYSTYRIFRGTSYDNMQMIGEIPSDNTTFTDNNAPEGYVYYQIVVLLSAPGAKDASNEIRSNVATNDQTGIGSVAEGYLNVYQQNGDIVVETVQGQPLQVYDLSGRKLFDVISTGVDRFEVPVTGVYLIRVEGMKAHRIVVEK